MSGAGRLLLLSILLILPAALFADEPAAETVPDKQLTDEAAEATEEDVPEDKALDRHKSWVDTRVQDASQWIDSFFGDPNYDNEIATSQIRLRPELYYRDEQGAKARMKASFRFDLPNAGRKTNLVIGNDYDGGSFGDSVEDEDDDLFVGFQFFGKQSRHWHTSLSAGVKFNEFAGFVGPRIRYYKALSEKRSWRFTQSVRWQTNNFWQINSRLDFNFVLGTRYFFRQTFDGRWRGEKSEEEGYRTRVSSFLTRRLKNSAGLQYEFTTIFHTKPDTHVDKYTLAFHYRKRTKRDWLYYEIVPQLSFENEFDYKANPGIRLRVEVFYGAAKDTQFRKRRAEDTDDFRW